MNDVPLRRRHSAGAAATLLLSLVLGAVGAPAASAAPAPTAPVATVSASQLSTYVTSVYQDLFGRQPDPAGLSLWTTKLASGTPRDAVAGSITSSEEYRSGLITEAYQEYLGRVPEPAGLRSWLAGMGAGMTIQQMEVGFTASPEYFQAAGGTRSGWVRTLYTDVLGRQASASEVQYWTELLGRNVSREQVAAGFLLSTEHLRSVIDGHYVTLLGRSIDPSGQATWVGAIQAGRRVEAVIGSIVASDEYFYANGGVSGPVASVQGSGGSLSNGCAVSVRGVPACGTLVGAAVGSNTDPASFESAVGGRLGVRRTFFQASGVDGAVRIAQADAAAGRVSWMSFKVPYSWAEMAAGKGDAWAADLTARLGATGGTVWVAFHHEPEKDGVIGDWVAMQRHLSPVVHAAAPNVAFSMIVTGWNQFYGPSEYSMDAIWPGDGLVDVLGFDIYNEYGWVRNGVSSTETVDAGSQYFGKIQAFASAHGVAWGLAETAYTNASSDVDPTWIARTYDQMAAAGGVAFSYFNTTLNNEGGTWPLAYGSKTSVYSSILARSPRLS